MQNIPLDASNEVVSKRETNNDNKKFPMCGITKEFRKRFYTSVPILPGPCFLHSISDIYYDSPTTYGPGIDQSQRAKSVSHGYCSETFIFTFTLLVVMQIKLLINITKK